MVAETASINNGGHPAHRLMEHIQGFTRSYWMPPSVECLRRISLVAAMVIMFE
jgi:hypothetical protein